MNDRVAVVAIGGNSRHYLAEGGHFGSGSMAPQIQAVISFLEHGGREAIVTSPGSIEGALAGRTGTRITPDQSS